MTATSEPGHLMSVPSSVAHLARRLLHPGLLSDALRSGLFLLQEPGSASWNRFAPALTGELESLGALVLYLDLADSDLVPTNALRRVLTEGLFDPLVPHRPSESIGSVAIDDLTVPTLIEAVMGRSGKDLVLMCNQVGRLAVPVGEHALKALKAARDHINLRPNRSGRFILVATDTDSAVLRRCAMHPAQAFFGATIEPMPAV